MSFDEDILTLKPVPNLSFEHPYLPRSLMFHSIPSASLKTNDILASSSVYGMLVKLLLNPFSLSVTVELVNILPL
ncbi:hypothetical protein EJD97_018623 [Solanum chilense]|uniref:Uncharacterized protein n=1 Tax=Solanum chilense TaxID=4083 RepID=A0A6N2B2W7_SOLCI|nr:hypothetical protein EJD97_018623 [Solanum chilense]